MSVSCITPPQVCGRQHKCTEPTVGAHLGISLTFLVLSSVAGFWVSARLVPVLQLLATVLITIGAILGIVGWAQISSLGHVRRLLLAHMVIGLILFGFVIIQVSAALMRPSHTSNLRCGISASKCQTCNKGAQSACR